MIEQKPEEADIEAFENWWHNEGSGMPPNEDEDAATHVERISRLAWLNGAYCSRSPLVKITNNQKLTK